MATNKNKLQKEFENKNERVGELLSLLETVLISDHEDKLLEEHVPIRQKQIMENLTNAENHLEQIIENLTNAENHLVKAVEIYVGKGEVEYNLRLKG